MGKYLCFTTFFSNNCIPCGNIWPWVLNSRAVHRSCSPEIMPKVDDNGNVPCESVSDESSRFRFLGLSEASSIRRHKGVTYSLACRRIVCKLTKISQPCTARGVCFIPRRKWKAFSESPVTLSLLIESFLDIIPRSGVLGRCHQPQASVLCSHGIRLNILENFSLRNKCKVHLAAHKWSVLALNSLSRVLKRLGAVWSIAVDKHPPSFFSYVILLSSDESVRPQNCVTAQR